MRWDIQKKLVLMVVGIVLVFSSAAGLLCYQMNVMEDGIEDMVGRTVPMTVNLLRLDKELQRESSLVRGFIITKDGALVNNFQDSKATVNQLLSEWEKNSQTKESREYQKKLKDGYQQYWGFVDKAVSGIQAGQDVSGVVKQAGTAIAALEKDTNDAVRFTLAWQEEQQKKREESTKKMMRWLSIGVVGAALLTVWSGIYFARTISRPMKELANGAVAVAKGDLREVCVLYRGNDELKDLIDAFCTMTKDLRTLINGVQDTAQILTASSEELTASSRQTADASAQVAHAVTDVAEGAERQLSGVEQVVQTVGEMERAVEHVATAATGLAAESSQAAIAAQGGRQTAQTAQQQMENIRLSVQNTAQAVQNLGERSQQIGEIVQVIAGIAGQTNLLALNAAIEAARAGEQGKGFAVVAEEVRKLAEQSQTAAGRIESIIHQIQDETEQAVQAMETGSGEVEKGTGVMAEAGTQFAQLTEMVENLNRQVQEISAAAQQLAASGEMVLSQVQGVRGVAQETSGHAQTISASAQEQSATVEEIAAASRELAQTAENLQSKVARFHVH